MVSNHNKHLLLLQEHDALPNLAKSESIFDIAGYPHYENVCSNILAFYLNPNNEHQLGDLFLSSLMNLANGNESYQEPVQVHREVFTNEGGRLDIVIETDNQIIGVENKLFHHLHNNLADYSETLDEWSKVNQLEAVKIILGLRKEEESHGFVCVIYEELWSKIREQLGYYVSTSSQKWLLYLIDFMNSIDKISGKTMELDNNDKFFIENEDRVNTLINDRNKFITKLNNRVRELLELTEQPDYCDKQWIHAKACLVHDFKLSASDFPVALDLCISPRDWRLVLFGRNKDARSYVSDLIKTSPLNEREILSKGPYYLLQRFALETELIEIKENLLEWMRLVIQTSKNANKTNAADL